jgi:hypothetical protein
MMAGHLYTENGQRSRNSVLNRNIKLKCLQVNLQHSRVATSNLTQIIIQYNVDIAFAQEPYTSHDNVTGFPKGFKIFAHWGHEESSHNNK